MYVSTGERYPLSCTKMVIKLMMMKASMILSLRKKLITCCFIAAMWRVNMFLRIFSIRKNRVLQKRSESTIMAIVELKKVIPLPMAEPSRISNRPKRLPVQSNKRGGTVNPHVSKP